MVSEADKEAAVAYWRQQLGSREHLSPAQFDLLAKTITMLSRGRNKVVVVDLPVPDWWDAATPMYREYKDRLAALEKAMAGGSVTFMSLGQFEKPEYFSDEVHAKPGIARRIGEEVAAVVNAEACSPARQTHMMEGHR